MDDIEKLKAENTSLKRALEDERSKLGTILQSIVDGVYTTDMDKRITFWNKGAERITGFRAEDVTGKLCSEILRHMDESGNSLCSASCPIANTLSVKNAIIGKDVYSGTASGKFIPVSVSCAPIIDNGGATTGAIEVFRDISGQKQLERQKEDFYSMLTHDLKAPLQVIMGYAELMNGMTVDQLAVNSEEFLKTILINCSSMHSLINDFLSISKLETGAMPLSLRRTDVLGLIRQVRDNYVPACLKNGIVFSTSLPDNFHELVVDEKLFERVLSNIIGNAVKFTPSGGAVSISLSEADGSAVIKISDTGPGIGPDEIKFVFEKYYRAKSASGADGTGLGLAIAKSVIEAHNGTISIQSVPGNGSDFIISLPINNLPENEL